MTVNYLMCNQFSILKSKGDNLSEEENVRLGRKWKGCGRVVGKWVQDVAAEGGGGNQSGVMTYSEWGAPQLCQFTLAPMGFCIF